MPPPTPSAAHRTAAIVGLATAAIGGALLVAPVRAGAAVGVSDPRGVRLVGLVDLALVPGLLLGRPRWPWMAARAVLNPPTALYFVRHAAGAEASRRARIAAAVLAVATIADTRAVAALLRSTD